MQTNVASGDAIAIKLFSVAVFAQTQRKNGFSNRLTGPAPKQADAESKIRNQTSPDYPIVRVTDLSDNPGDQVSVDMFHIIGGPPLMGDVNAEGKGERLQSASMNIKIDLVTKPLDVGGKMSRKRTKHNLRRIGMANLVNWFNRFNDQQTLVHLAGARGSETGPDWVIPLASDPTFATVMVNPILAPSYNRHFVADGTSLVRGGLQSASLDTTDVLKLEHIEGISALLSEDQFTLQPIRIEDDPAADDEPLWVMYVSYRAWHQVNINTSGQVWRTFLQNAWNRASMGSKHPLFKGDAGMWGNILVKRLQRNVRFNPSASYKYVAVADRYTGAESTGTLPSLSAGYVVDRCIILGGQAMAHVYGKNGDSGTYANWMEKPYNFDRAMQIAGDMMTGKSKLRFDYFDPSTMKKEPTDHGVAVLDVVSPPLAS